MNHKQKLHIARSIRSHEDLKSRKPIFQTSAWEARKAGIKAKVESHEKRVQEMARKKKEKE